ncbi:hypothetical protein B0O80DRAFT_269752 [Mortierella sp. GBAus27b]|nr:hypothetical protein B0O80DRAFT_269752 [Mortierella sp. GBAus27b]
MDRGRFVQHWPTFIEILTKLDSQQLNLDYDKKEMMVFWNKVMFSESDRTIALAKFKPIGVLLRKFYVCLQHNQANVQYHQEILPIYFGLVLRFSKLDSSFHMEWAQCHNYTWALGAMKWGQFTQHCPEELNQLLQFTLSRLPQYRSDCWRAVPPQDNPRHLAVLIAVARCMFEAENELAGSLFYQHRGLVLLTDAILTADQNGTLTKDHEFFAVDALTLLCDYLCQMEVCRNTPSFAEAMDHWSNINTAIDLLTGNLMWTAPPHVYTMSIKILNVIAKEATFSQAVPILVKLSTEQSNLRETFEDDKMNDRQLQSLFGGVNSPFSQYGVLESHQSLSGMGSPPMRIGPLIFMHPGLFMSLEAGAAQQVLREWFVPYWELAQSACLLDGGDSGHQKMAIELAALMALEQLSVGSLMHAKILWEAASDTANREGETPLLHNRFVALFVGRFLKREQYQQALTSQDLKNCALLFKVCGLEEQVRVMTIEESLSQAEQVVSLGEKARDSQESGLSEKHVQDLITALQNLAIVEVDVKEEQNEASARLRQLFDKVRAALPQLQLPEGYQQVLSEIIHLESGNGDAKENEGSNEAGSDEDPMTKAGDDDVEIEHDSAVVVSSKLAAVHGSDEDAEVLSTEEEPTVMTGIIEDSASEGNTM